MQIEAERLVALATRIFAAAGCDEATAACVARHLVDSNLCGHDSHGVVRVPRYLGFMEEGVVDPAGRAEVVFDNTQENDAGPYSRRLFVSSISQFVGCPQDT